MDHITPEEDLKGGHDHHAIPGWETSVAARGTAVRPTCAQVVVSAEAAISDAAMSQILPVVPEQHLTLYSSMGVKGKPTLLHSGLDSAGDAHRYVQYIINRYDSLPNFVTEDRAGVSFREW